MKPLKSLNPVALIAVLASLCLAAGCGMSTTTSSGNSSDTRRAGVWLPSGTPLDSGPFLDVTPEIAVQPNGGGGAVAVWVKQVDLDPADSFPAVYHLYAAHWTGGVFDTKDTTNNICPAGISPFGNPDITGDDGVCVIDTGKAQYDAWSPKVSMDANGDAIVVWQQHDGTAMRVYARRYSFSSKNWGPFQQLNDSIEYAAFDAGDPAIALSPTAGSAMAAWSQFNEKDWTQIFDSNNNPVPPRSPTVASGTNWTATPSGTLSNAVNASDTFYATYSGTTQDDLCVTGFGFVITANYIKGIIVSVQGNGASGTATDRQYRIGLTKTGCTLDGIRKTGIQMNQTTDTTTTTGDLNDQWGSSWLPTDVGTPLSPNPSFGVLISDNDTDPAAGVLNINRVTVTIITDQTAQCPGFANNNCALVPSMVGVYQNQLFAGMGGIQRGDADIYVYNKGTNAWSYSFNDGDPTNGYELVTSMAIYNGKLYAGLGSNATNFEGDVRVFDGTTWTTLITNNLSCGGGSPPCANVGGASSYNAVRSMAVYNNQLYIGMGNGNGLAPFTGNGDIWRCTVCDGVTPGDFQMVWNSPPTPNVNFYGSVSAMTVYQCPTCPSPQLYAGFGNGLTATTNTADVKRCTICDGSDWTNVIDNSGTYGAVLSLAVHNGKLYIGYGDDLTQATNGNGDIWRCTACDGTLGDMNQVFEATNYPENYQAVNSMISYNGFLYIGLGNPGTAAAGGDGDIKRCRVCDPPVPSDWTDVRNDGQPPYTPAQYDSVHSLAVYDGELYAGFGNGSSQDGDIWRFSAGWQTVARRFVNGVGWDTSDTICPAGSGVDDGICYISGGAAFVVQPTLSPRVKVDSAGRAIATFIQMIQQADCFATPTIDPITVNYNLTLPAINCMDSELHANLFDGTSWQSPIDLDPDTNLAGTGSTPGTPGSVALPQQLICFVSSTGGPATRGDVSSTDACINVNEYDLAMDNTGKAFVLIKTSWGLSEDFGVTPLNNGTCNNLDTGSACLPDENAFEAYMGAAIVGREFDIATLGSTCPSWTQANVPVCWSLARLANYGTYPVVTTPDNITSITTPTAFGIGPFAGGCPSGILIDGDGTPGTGRVILNCKFNNPRIAIEPDGGAGATAVAVYETYDGTTFGIQAHRFDGTSWSGPVEIDAGGGDAHAPQIAVDNAGNGVAVWTQNDGTQFRIESNCYANDIVVLNTCGALATGWKGAENVDGGVMGESAYYNPVIGLPGTGGAGNALSLFLGWSVLDNSTRVFYATGP